MMPLNPLLRAPEIAYHLADSDAAVAEAAVVGRPDERLGLADGICAGVGGLLDLAGPDAGGRAGAADRRRGGPAPPRRAGRRARGQPDPARRRSTPR